MTKTWPMPLTAADAAEFAAVVPDAALVVDELPFDFDEPDDEHAPRRRTTATTNAIRTRMGRDRIASSAGEREQHRVDQQSECPEPRERRDDHADAPDRMVAEVVLVSVRGM